MSLSKPAVPRACRAVRYASNSFLSTPGAGPSKSMSTKGKDKSHHVLDYSASAFPTGFAVGSTKAGIKKSGALDLGVLISTSSQPCSAAACLTRNAFKAAPVTVTSELLRTYNGKARGVVVNSGCANAVTGKKGLEDAWSMSNTVTGLLGEDAESGGTLVMSTGVIGQHLPIDSITSAIPPIVSRVESSPSGWLNLARAFMTTDTFPKLRTMSYDSAGKTVKFVGIDKGAGMIAPSMGPPHATLLGVIATDAAVEPKALQSALQYAVDRSFNAITVDGDMSTNDTIIALANGASGAEIIKEGSTEFEGFRDELKKLAEELAQLVVRDGEGATKFVTVRVKGASSFEDADAVAKSISTSSLVKTAMYGEDANWGRILCAVGYTPGVASTIDPAAVSVSFIASPQAADQSPLRLLTRGEPEANIDEARASEILAEEDLSVEVDLGQGNEEATVWTCDFSHEYVTINGSYRT